MLLIHFQMSINLSEKMINDILTEKPLSISAINRELKNKGCIEHRLVLTGYLRALRDMNKLQEINVPPSKVYKLLKSKEKSNDIYSIIGENIKNMNLEMKIPVAVSIISKLFKRPVFKEELVYMNINSKHISTYLESDICYIKPSKDENLKLYRADITRIFIPPNDPAYEIKEEDIKIAVMATLTMIELVKDFVDVSGLAPRTKQINFNDF